MSDLRDIHEQPTLLVPDLVLRPDGPKQDQAVLVEAGRIAGIGSLEQLRERAAKQVDLPGRLLMPGLIDAHHHLTQTFGKALAFGEPSEIFRRLWVPMENHMTEEAIDVATRLAALESLRGGFTTVVDAGTRASADLATVADAATAVGLRCVLGAICNDLSGDNRIATNEQVMASAQAHLDRWGGYDLIHPSLAISIPEAASDETLVNVSSLAREAGVTFQTHVNEHLVAVERSLENTGMRPLERLAHLGALGPEMLAAHATLLTPHEMTLLRDNEAAISYNPVASSWKGNAVAPALLLHEMGVRIGLGTDGTRSDAFRLLDAAETAQRFAHTMAIGDSSSGGGWLWLEQGLRSGADAAALRGQVGEITRGAYADLLVMNLDVPEFVPSWDLEWELVRLANRDQIEAVIVNGRLQLEHGRPVGWDEKALIGRAREIAEATVTAAPIQRINPTAGEHRARRMGNLQ